MSGPPLGRRPQHVSTEDKQQAAADEAIRNTVEGKFGQGKRRFGLARIMAKLASTSAAQISLSFLVMNLQLALRRFFLSLLFLCYRLANRRGLTLGTSWPASPARFATRRPEHYRHHAPKSRPTKLLVRRSST